MLKNTHVLTVSPTRILIDTRAVSGFKYPENPEPKSLPCFCLPRMVPTVFWVLFRNRVLVFWGTLKTSNYPRKPREKCTRDPPNNYYFSSCYFTFIHEWVRCSIQEKAQFLQQNKSNFLVSRAFMVCKVGLLEEFCVQLQYNCIIWLIMVRCKISHPCVQTVKFVCCRFLPKEYSREFIVLTTGGKTASATENEYYTEL